MPLLRAPLDYLGALTGDVRSAFGPLGELLVATAPEIKQDKCEGIKDDMKDSPLSSWFSLFVRAIFRYAYEGDEQYYILLPAMRGVSEAGTAALVHFREKAVTDSGGISKQLGELRLQQKDLLTASFYPGPGGKTLLERDGEITRAITALEDQKKPTLALFLLVEKIIVILQEFKRIGRAEEALIKEKNPIQFMADLIPILRLLQNGEERELIEVITLTLQLVDISDARLASKIKKTLLERHWLEVVVPEEERGNCLTRALGHLFFRQRRRRISPHDALPEAEEARHTDEDKQTGLVGDQIFHSDAFEEIEEEDDDVEGVEVLVQIPRSLRTKIWHVRMGEKFEKLPEINEEDEVAMEQVP